MATCAIIIHADACGTLRDDRVLGGEGAGNRPSRGGQTIEIHAITDCHGRPATLRLTPGNISDVGAAK